ncbi:MAG TPA: SDR family NAD(P)-dependent oxidoreductase [Myxococcota bacterium]|nr:SDR family NAD(P)-dependent oxidoreductase [Myxococcota bacterium]
MANPHPGPALVTGANSGIGLATALRLAERDWTVYGTVRSEAKADVLREAARKRKLGRRVHALVLDVSDHAAVVAGWRDLPDFFAVVNNAGYSETGAVEEVSAASAKAQLDVNLVAPAVVSACALPGMRRRGDGRIVMVSSVAGRASVLPLNGWYHASKFGLEALSDVLRVEVAGFGVRVVIVEPGFFRTAIGDKSRARSEALGGRASPYATAYARMAGLLELAERFAPAAEVVARTIASAIESRRPRPRYVVGLDALATIATQPFIPRELTDLAMRLVSGLPRR